MTKHHLSHLTDSEKLDYYLIRAELGNPQCQYWTSQYITAVDYYPNRKIEALKWLIIATLLDPLLIPKDVLTFMQTHLSDEERDQTFNLVQEWLEDKSRDDSSRDESAWAIELLNWKYPDKDHRTSATDIDIKHWLFAMLEGTFDRDLIETMIIHKLDNNVKSNWDCEFILKNNREITEDEKLNFDSIIKMGQLRWKLN